MSYCWDMLTLSNLILCIIILGIGCWSYAVKKNKAHFGIGVAFGLFAVSHLISLMGMEYNLSVTVILIRVFAYLIVAFALLGI